MRIIYYLLGKLLRIVQRQIKTKYFYNKIKNSYKKLKHKRHLTNEQAAEVQEFYKGLIGKKVPLIYHEYTYSITGVYNKEYIPLELHGCDLLPKANNYKLEEAYDDKNMQVQLLRDENIPHTFLQNINEYFYFEGKAVTREEAIQLCQNLGRMVIKPADGEKGKGVKIITLSNGVNTDDGKTVGQLFDQYKKNYLIQECVRQHIDMAALNPTSVNTIRILTFRSEFEVLHIYSVIRIGGKGSVIDNQHAGGISTKINPDGRIDKTAIGGMDRDNITQTDSGVTLDGYQVPSYREAVDYVKRLHTKLPYFKMIRWDIAIGEDGRPIVIEFNLRPGLSQAAFRSGFGEYTERIISELWSRPNTLFC